VQRVKPLQNLCTRAGRDPECVLPLQVWQYPDKTDNKTRSIDRAALSVPLQVVFCFVPSLDAIHNTGPTAGKGQ